MSIIAAKIEADKIIIGADTQTTKGGYMKILNAPEKGHAKLYCLEETILVGSAGYSAVIEFFRRFIKNDKKLKERGIFREADFSELMIEFNQKLQDDTDNKLSIKDNSFLFVYDGKCYQFSAWHIFEVRDFTAIGSGMEVAWAAYETQKLYGLEFSMEKILMATCCIDLYCHEPLIIYEMEKATGKITLINDE